MPLISTKRLGIRLKSLLGIRGRLVLMALILVAPMMVDRVRVLEQTRSQQIQNASAELRAIARNSATAEREVISSIEALLKSSAYIYSIASKQGRGCAILRASLQVDLPWIKSMSVADTNGIIKCSTMPSVVGIDISDRPFFKNVLETHEFTLSDYFIGRGSKAPSIAAAYSTLAFDDRDPVIIISNINLDWLTKIIAFPEGRPGLQAMLVDSKGMIIAERPERPEAVGRPMDDLSVLSMIGAQHSGSLSMMSADGTRKAHAFHKVDGTGARIIVRSDEATMLAAINADIRQAYMQLAIVVLIALAGAWFASERLIIRPIRSMTAMARRFGAGDWTVRATRTGLPSEFVPLARAFNIMAVQLAGRERELVANNDRLTVMASNDLVSGLANRRGFQSRLDFEWLKAEQTGAAVALLMIDVDHFKPFNDTYGHPEGDVCLGRIGEALAAVASETAGFAARYGGEEFCLLVPGADTAMAMAVGEMVRTRIETLAIPHTGSEFGCVTVSAGVAHAQPNGIQQPVDLIEAADAALYQAKSGGRNLVIEHGLICRVDRALALAS